MTCPAAERARGHLVKRADCALNGGFRRNHFPEPRSRPETKPGYQLTRVKTTGVGHGNHPQRNLPRIPQERPFRQGNLGGKAMTEVVTALLVFLSIGVFLAHAFDAYRTGAVGTRNPRY
jgi:hypothetical protein